MGTGKLELKMKLVRANAELAEREAVAKKALAQKDEEMAALKAKMEEMLRQQQPDNKNSEDVHMDDNK
jgi:hypothetical protein